jgi:hypothetical protein
MLADEEERDFGAGPRGREWHTVWKQLSWGAILAGTVVTLAVFLTLQLLGAGIGAAVIDLTGRTVTSGTELGIGAAIWWLITGLISLFIGGFVAGRLNWLPNALDRMLHGLTTWAAFYAIMFLLVTTALGALLGGGLSLLSNTVAAAGQAADSPQAQQTAQQGLAGMGLSPDVIRQEIAKAVGAGGQQGDESLVTAIRDYLRGSRTPQERQQLAQQIAQTTGKSEAEADQMITNLEQKGQQAKETGEQAANITGATFIGLSIAMILGALAAALGSLVAPAPKFVPPYRGVRERERAEAETYASR